MIPDGYDEAARKRIAELGLKLMSHFDGQEIDEALVAMEMLTASVMRYYEPADRVESVDVFCENLRNRVMQKIDEPALVEEESN